MNRAFLLLTLPLASLAAPAHGAVIFTTEHIDYSINYRASDRTFLLTARDENNRVEYGAGLTNQYHDADTRVDLPPLPPEFSFLGNEGDTIWLGSATGQNFNGTPGPYAGFSTETKTSQPGWTGEGMDLQYLVTGIPPGVFQDDSVSMTLVGMTGPADGKFFLFQSDPFGVPIHRMRTDDGIDPTQDIYTFFDDGAGNHVHFNWAFTQQGMYGLTFQARGTLLDGTVVFSDPTTFYFGAEALEIPQAAVPEPATAALLALACAPVMLGRRRRTVA